MGALGEVVVVWDILPEVAAKMEKVLSQAVRKAAFDVQATAAKLAPVDSGFLKNSIYVVTESKSNYQAKADKAMARADKKGVEREILPEVPPPLSPTEAIVAVGASYGVYVEYGGSSYPKPFLTPAVEFVRPKFMHALELLEEKLAQPISADDVYMDVGEE